MEEENGKLIHGLVQSFSRFLDDFIVLQKGVVGNAESLALVMRQVIELKEKVAKLEEKNGI